VQRHVDSNNFVIFAVLLELKQVIALMAVNNKELVAANYSLLYMLIKVLQPLQANLV
jgi:hypothetical protein